MTRRTLLTPLLQLGRPERVGFIELIAEPDRQGHAPFSALQGLGLDAAIGATNEILRPMEAPRRSSLLYWTNPTPMLTQTDGVRLALALGTWAFSRSDGYRRIIAAGGLLTADCIVGPDAVLLAEKAISALPRAASATCLIVPPAGTAAARAAILRIESLGIDVFQVVTLRQAIRACFFERELVS